MGGKPPVRFRAAPGKRGHVPIGRVWPFLAIYQTDCRGPRPIAIFAGAAVSPRWTDKGVLSFPRRPAISLGAGTAHKHCPLSVAQAVGGKKRLDRLLEVDHSERARPVRAPEAAIETPGIEHAGKRGPNVRKGKRLPGQRAGAAD